VIHGELIGRARVSAGLLVLVVGLLAAAPLGAEAVRIAPTVDPPRWSAKSTEFMHASYFSPNLGRFLSVDPVGGEVGSSQSWNRYSYTLNDPIGMIDPDGQTSWAVGKRVFSVVWQQSKTNAREILKFRAKNPAELREAVSRAMEQVPEGARVALNTSDPAMNETAAKALSSSGRARGAEASPGFTEHFNPADGQFENVHVQSHGDWAKAMGKNASFTAAIMAAVAPASSALADDPQASFAEVLSAALWDATCALDPVFITEGINWAFDLDFDTAAE